MATIDTILERMPHKVLTRIQGEPTFVILETIQREIRANAKAIHSTLGGGTHGHLGLVMTAAAYAHISEIPFIQPVHPGLNDIPAGTTAHVAAAMRDTHTERLASFNYATSVNAVIKAQIKAVIDLDYLDEELDDDTDDFLHNIPTTLTHLFSEYGKVEAATVREKEQELLTTGYNPELPMGPFFKTTDKLLTLAEAAQIPYKPEQHIQIVKDILKGTGCFGRAIEKWNIKPLEEKTWTNFKAHFKEARRTMKTAGTLRNNQSTLHSANAIKQIVVDGMQQVLQQHLAAHIPAFDPSGSSPQYEHNLAPRQVRA